MLPCWLLIVAGKFLPADCSFDLIHRFLFTQDDIGHNKSTCAIAAVHAMYPQMNAESLTDLVAPSTEAKFHADFWNKQVSCAINNHTPA